MKHFFIIFFFLFLCRGFAQPSTTELFQIWEESDTKQRFFAYFEQEIAYQGQRYRYMRMLDENGKPSFIVNFILSGWIGNHAGEYHKLDLAEWGFTLTTLNFTPLNLKNGQEDTLKPLSSIRYYKISHEWQTDSISIFRFESDLLKYEGEYSKEHAFLSLSVTEKQEGKTKKYKCVYVNQPLWKELNKPVLYFSKNLFANANYSQIYEWESSEVKEIIHYSEPFWVDLLPIYYLEITAYQGVKRVRGQLLNEFMFYWHENQLRITTPYNFFYENNSRLNSLVFFELDKPIGTVWRDGAEFALANTEQVKLEAITWDSLRVVKKYHFSTISKLHNEIKLVGFDFCKEIGFLCFYYQSIKEETLTLKLKM